MNRRIRTVFFKESLDNIRDTTSLLLICAFVLGPIAGALIINRLGARHTRMVESDRGMTLPVYRVKNAPGLVRYLKQRGVIIIPANRDPSEYVSSGRYDVALLVPDSYEADLRAARIPKVQLVYQHSRFYTLPVLMKISDLLLEYGATVGKLRLLAHGIDPTINESFAIHKWDISPPQAFHHRIIDGIVLFTFIIVAMAGYSIIIDTTAGQMERGSLEPLLINPVKRWEFVTGKFLAAFSFSAITVAAALILAWLATQLSSSDDSVLGIKLAFVLMTIFPLILPLIALTTALWMIISIYSRTIKHAQAALGLITIVPIAACLVPEFLGLGSRETPLWMMSIPYVSEQFLIRELFSPHALKASFLATSLGSTSVAAIIAFFIASRLLRGERPFMK